MYIPDKEHIYYLHVQYIVDILKNITNILQITEIIDI